MHLLRHGGQVVRVHSNMMRHVKFTIPDGSVETPEVQDVTGTKISSGSDSVYTDPDEISDTPHQWNEKELEGSDLLEGSSDMIQKKQDNVIPEIGDMIQKKQDNVIPEIGDNSDQSEQVSDRVVAKLTSFPKTGQKIRLVLRDPSVLGVDYAGTALSRGGKKTVQYKNYYNIEFEKPDACHGVTDCLDFKNDVLHWEPSVDEETCLLTVSDEHKASISFAKQAEYESWLENEVFEVVTDNHQHCISTK